MTETWDPAQFGLTPVQPSLPQAPASSASPSSGSGGDMLDPARYGLTPAPAASASQSSGGSQYASDVDPNVKTGYAANVAAGAVRGATGGLNTISDPFGNLVGKPLAIVAGTLHDTFAPMFGYHKFSPEDRAALFGDDGPQLGDRVAGAVQQVVGAPSIDTVRPGSFGQQLVGAGTEAATGMLGFGLGGAASGATVGNLIRAGAGAATVGAAGGVTGELAATAAPDDYKPVASLAGNIVGGMVPAGVGVAARGGLNVLADFAAPVTGRRNALMDLAGQPIVGADGAPITATPNQVQMAGNQLRAATSDPAAVAATLANPPAPLVAGVQPTTAQLTRDPGLGMQEYRVSRSGTPLEQAAFRSRQDQQNDARVAALQDVGNGADPSAVPTYLQQQAGDIRNAGDARVAQAQSTAQAQVDAARTGGEQQIAGAQQQAGDALNAIGGNLPAGSDATIGQMLRQPIQESLAQTKAREGALWDAIDPDRTLAVDMSGVQDRAAQIRQQIGPNAAPPTGEEAAILQTAANVPNVQSFSDLADLRSRITTQLRDAKSNGRDQEAARLSQLLDGVHDTMEGTVAGRVAQDNAAVQAGTMAPENSMEARMAAHRAAWYDQQRADVAQQAQVSNGTTGRDAIGGSSSFSPVGGEQSPTGRRSGAFASNSGLQEGQSLVPNFDQAAADRYAAARSATADRAATFKNAPGVGQALQQGSTAGTFRAPDSAVPNLIVKVGPAGADVAQAYLRAGGSTDALTNAAAYSLRQAAMRPDGTLDVGRYQTWAKQRSAFLSQIPDAAARFGAAADAQRAATGAVKAHDLTMHQAAAAAKQTVDDAMAARATAIKMLQTSALGKFLDGSDPVTRVGSILRDKATGQVQMRQLAKAVEGDAAAKAGLQRAVGEYITRELVGNSKGIESESGAIRADRFQTFLRNAGPALREALTPGQVDAMQRVGASLEQTNFLSQVGVGSPTAQLTAGRGETLMGKIAGELGKSAANGTASLAGYAAGGPLGGFISHTIVGPAANVLQKLREAGVSNVEGLKTQALLNPELFRVLTSTSTPRTEASLMNKLADQLAKVSLVGGVQASRKAEQQARQVQTAPGPRLNSLMPLVGTMPPTHRNSLMLH